MAGISFRCGFEIPPRFSSALMTLSTIGPIQSVFDKGFNTKTMPDTITVAPNTVPRPVHKPATNLDRNELWFFKKAASKSFCRSIRALRVSIAVSNSLLFSSVTLIARRLTRPIWCWPIGPKNPRSGVAPSNRSLAPLQSFDRRQ